MPQRKKFYARKRELERAQCQTLELDVLHLQHEIASLQRARELLYARALNRADDRDGTCVRTLRAYYGMLRVSERMWDDERKELDPRLRAIICSAYDQDVRVGPIRGRDDFMHMMVRYHVMEEQTMELERVDVLASGEDTGLDGAGNAEAAPPIVLVSRARIRGRITHRFLINLLPHLAAHPSIVAKLVGRTLESHSSSRLEMDRETNQVVAVDMDANFAGGIAQLLDSVEDLAVVFQHELVVPEQQYEHDLVQLERQDQGSWQESDAEDVELRATGDESAPPWPSSYAMQDSASCDFTLSGDAYHGEDQANAACKAAKCRQSLIVESEDGVYWV